MAGIVGTHLVAQVGFIVKDTVESRQKEMGGVSGAGSPPNAADRRV